MILTWSLHLLAARSSMAAFLTLKHEQNLPCMAVQAQCILFKRCSEDLAPFKYAGYPMLLQAISLPDDGADADGTTQRPPAAHFLGDEIAPRLMVRGLAPRQALQHTT